MTIDFDKLKHKKKKEDKKKVVVKQINYDLEIDAYNNKILCLYQKYRDGNLSKEDFLTQRIFNEEKIESLKVMKLAKENELKTKEYIKEEVLPQVVKYKNIKKLTRELICEFVDKILVCGDNRVEIKLKCKDIFNFLKSEQN